MLAFWDTMPLKDVFKEMDKDNFFEVMNRSRREKKAHKVFDGKRDVWNPMDSLDTKRQHGGHAAHASWYALT